MGRKGLVMNESQKIVTILVPCFNEEAGLAYFHQEVSAVIDDIKGYDFEFLFIDDGSRDGTVAVMQSLRSQDPRVSWLSLSRNFGKETAMLAGLDYAKGDAIIFMDADLQDPPSLIPELIQGWEEGYQDVYGKRRLRKGEKVFKLGTAWLFYRLLRTMSMIDIPADVGDFRLLDRQAAEALRSMREHQRYTKGMFSWIGFRKKEVLFDRAPRAMGDTKMSFKSLLRLAVNGFLSFSVAPLRLASFVGVITSMSAMIALLFIVIRAALYGDPVAGWPSLVAIILFTGGIQLLVLGIISEYLGDIFTEAKGRPDYLASEYNGERIFAYVPVKAGKSVIREDAR